MNGSPLHTVIIPRSDLLHRYIYSFNVLNFFSEEEIKYTAFPQRGITVGFFKEADIKIEGNKIQIRKNPKATPKAILLNKYLCPLQITYHDYVEKISVHFKEAAVHAFFPSYFNRFSGEKARVVELEELELCSETLFGGNIQENQNYLENKLLEKMSPVDYSALQTTLETLDQNPGAANEQLASAVNVSEKTLNRHFKKVIGCGLKDYKRLIRFRTVIENFQEGDQKKMQHLCYDGGFYDPSHFNRSIAAVTGYTPKKFFSDVKKMGLENHIYIFQ